MITRSLLRRHFTVTTGMSIYLVSRTEAKLQEAAQQISQKFGVETKYYAADLAAAGKEPIDQSCWFGLKSNISGMDIGVLINNAGMSYGHPEYFHQLDPAEVDTMVAFNCASLVKMTYIVLPGMVERGRGAILNLGSASATGVPACPLLSLYAGTKCFVDAFSRCLDAEYKSKGIDVQVSYSPRVYTLHTSFLNLLHGQCDGQHTCTPDYRKPGSGRCIYVGYDIP